MLLGRNGVKGARGAARVGRRSEECQGWPAVPTSPSLHVARPQPLRQNFPQPAGGKLETDAAYQFFDNPKVTFDEVLQPHVDATRQGIAEQKVVLFVQDTTELDVTRPEQQVVGAGPMDGISRRGAYLHLMEAFTPDGTPLGAVWAEAWTRDDAAHRHAGRRAASHSILLCPLDG